VHHSQLPFKSSCNRSKYQRHPKQLVALCFVEIFKQVCLEFLVLHLHEIPVQVNVLRVEEDGDVFVLLTNIALAFLSRQLPRPEGFVVEVGVEAGVHVVDELWILNLSRQYKAVDGQLSSSFTSAGSSLKRIMGVRLFLLCNFLFLHGLHQIVLVLN